MTEEIGTSNLLRTWANDGTVVVPSNAKIDEGWLRGEQPPHEWMNYIHNSLGQKINHALSRGVADWNADTLYLVGSLARHDGRVWMSFVENSNSEPSSANSDWSVVQDARSSVVTDPLTVTVGATGDFPNYVAACEELSRARAGFSNFSGFPATVNILSGEAVESRLAVFGVDLSWINITSEDPEVTVVRSAIPEDGFLLQAADGAALPSISTLFSMDTSGAALGQIGIVLARNSRGTVSPGAGFKNFPGDAVRLMTGSNFSARSADFTGAGNKGLNCSLSRATIFACNFRKGATDSSDDIFLEPNRGSVVTANGATGGTNITPNEVTSNGIIFK